MSDLLTDLKTAYEKLGYRVSYDLVHTERGDKFQCWNAWKDGVGKQIPDVVTPDLCKEMKDWMLERGWGLQIFLHKAEGAELNYWKDSPIQRIRNVATEEEAILAAFLEVTKES